MKKVCVVALVLCLGIALGAYAATNVVRSVNIVGVQQIPVRSNGWSLLVVPFNELGGGSNLMREVLADQLVDGTIMTADKVYFFEASGQDYIMNWKSATGWKEMLVDSTQQLSTARGFWVLTSQITDQQLNLEGDVPLDNVITQHVYEEFNLLGYPYPGSVNVTNTDLDANAIAGNLFTADQIMKWDAGEQEYITYWKNAAAAGKWYYMLIATNIVFDQGEGFWFRRQVGNGEFDWEEPRPFDPDAE